MAQSNWHPTWWKEEHGTAWDRVREAMRRDWDQTKHDLHMGGHELNQNAKDTVKQAEGKENIPVIDKANPPKVIGSFDDFEAPLQYGHAARSQYGSKFATWNNDLESTLKTEWERGIDKSRRGWDDVKSHVRRGYEYDASKAS